MLVSPLCQDMTQHEPVISVDEMRAAEQAAMDAGVTERQLMQRAGEGAAQWVWRVAAGRAVTVLCGPGNNGGDGYVVAEWLRRRGCGVRVVAPLDPANDTATSARKAYHGEVLRDADDISAPILVDCLFGYGLSRPIGGELGRTLNTLVESHPYRIGIDLPSGVEADTGNQLTELPSYDLTLALGFWKRAHFLMPAMSFMGQRRLVPIELEAPDDASGFRAKSPSFDGPPSNAHKYSRGLAAIVAGSMPGAPILAAEAAMRSGAGYVKLFSNQSHPDAPADLVIDDGPLDNALEDERIDALLIGPGLGRENDARDRLGAVLATEKPCVIDADALHLLDSAMLQGRDTSYMLVTPHEGELAQLCKTFSVDAADKFHKARNLAERTGLNVLAKGPDTFLATRDRILFFDPGPSTLSVAGTGDMLAGLLTGRLANHGDIIRAAEESVALQHEAARLAGPVFSASDLGRHVASAYARFI